ncbi:MAG TPA: alpha/beta fold hydrolase [Solirubrobacterales bacterium]|nr:alpha/beta fold hydrolase [Solirubrobacterales bacterium]
MSKVDEILLHGHRVCFRLQGEGPPIILIHGITGRSDQWDPALGDLATAHTMLAPDLLGHGESAKPRGDYSLGAYASGVRDTMVALGIDRGTIVGHSLGGGIAMQFAYQFPERCERMVLVSSGGLGREVHPLLRAATLPGSEWVLPWLAHPRLIGVGDGARRLLAKLKLQAGTDLAEMARGFASLSDREARPAFIETMRAVLEPSGQRVSALDRLYLAESLPALLLWGSDDPIIPVAHGRAAHELMPGSRLEVMEGVGHFPQLERPREFASLLAEFVASTEAAELSASTLRDRLLVDASV